MQAPGEPIGKTSPALEFRWEELRGKFDASLRSGGRPRIEDFLALVPPDQRPHLLERLLATEVQVQSDRGETLALSDYRSRFADYASVVESVLAGQSGSGSQLPASTTHQTDHGASVTTPPSSAAPSGSGTKKLSAGVTVPPIAPASDRTEMLPASHPTLPRRGNDPAVLSRFKDYEILAEIARGGMGVVYKARQVKLNRLVAVKMILAGQFASDADIQRFYTEAEAAARLDHPGIVPIYEVDEFEGQHFFSMAFIDGSNLHERVSKGPLPQREAAELMRKVSVAVQYAHAHGVVHRDLKPRNILLTAEGEPKVTDFGLAKSVDSGNELTVSGQVIGTPGYMPPEQAQGQLTEISPRSDVYSLGAVLYCLLTGRPPFQAASLVDTLQHVVSTPPVSPRLLNPAVDRDLETICLKCLEKAQAHRYDSALELADELQRFLNGEPIRARRLGLLGRSWRWVRRRPTLAALAASIMVLVVVLGFAVSAGRRAWDARQLSAIHHNLETGLDRVELSPAYVARMNALITELERKEPAVAAESQRRLTEALAEQIQQELRAPKLTPDSIQHLTEAIALVAPRDARRGAELTDYLTRRRRDWQTIFALEPPYENARDVLPANAFVVQGDRLQPSAEALILKWPAVLSRIRSAGIVQVQTQWNADWETASRLGIALNATREDRLGYEFTLQAEPPTTRREDDGETVSATANGAAGERSFALWRQREWPLTATIRRQGRVLWRQEILSHDVPSGPLTMRAAWDGGELTFQVGLLTPIRFLDPFPLSGKQAGQFALLWPPGVSLRGFTGQRKERSTAASPLERGDELFDQEKYAEALEAYQEQVRAATEQATELEAQYKRGMCHLQLGQLDEAGHDFDLVFTAGNPRWSPLAGCRLWVLRLRQKRTTEAHGIFDTMLAKYEFGQLAGLIPQELCQEILASYRSDLNSFSGVLRYNPEIIETTRRLATVDRLLSTDGRGYYYTQIEVARAYHLQGEVAVALQMAEPVCLNSTDPSALRQYSRLLRLNNAPRKSLEAIDRFYQRRPDLPFGSADDAEVERARAYATLGDWERCEQAVLSLHRQQELNSRHSPATDAFIAIMRGMLLDRKGSRAAAEAVWGEGYRRIRAEVPLDGHARTETLIAMLLGSLSGQMTDADSEQFWSLLLQRGGDSAYMRQMQGLIDSRKSAAAMRTMWRTEIGRQYAFAYAFELLNLRDRVKLPVVLLGVEHLNLSLLEGNASYEQQLALFDTLAEAYDQLFTEGKVTLSHVAQLIFTWKGTTNFLGWGGVSPTLSPKLRTGMAYIFGHRFWRLGDRPQALKFFEQAAANAPPDSPLAKAILSSQQLAANNQGQVTIVNEAANPISLVVSAEGKPPQTITVRDRHTLTLPAGKVQVQLAEPREELQLAWDSLTLSALGQRTLQVTWMWRPTENPQVLPGLVSRPTPHVVNNRWQAFPRHSWPESQGVAFSSDGSLLAVAGTDRLLRIYDVATRELKHVLSNCPQGPRVMLWGPQGNKLLVAGYDHRIRGWELPSGELFFDRHEAAAVPALAWSQDGRRIAVACYGLPLRLFDSSGKLLSEMNEKIEGVESIALNADGTRLIARAYLPAEKQTAIAIIDTSSRTLEAQFPQTDVFYSLLSLSPDNRWLVSGDHTQGVRFWDWANRTEAFTYREGDQKLTSLHWSQDGNRLLLASEWQGVRLLDTSGSPPKVLKSWEKLKTATLSPDGKWLAVTRLGGRVSLQSIETDEELPLGTPAVNWEALSVCRATSQLTAGGTHGNLAVLDDKGRPTIWQDETAFRNWNSLAWNSTGTMFAAASKDRIVSVWDAKGQPLKIGRQTTTERVQALAWHPAGQFLAIINAPRRVRVIRAGDGEEQFTLPELESDLLAVAWAADGTLVTVTDGKQVQLWEAEGKPLHNFAARQSGSSIVRACVSPDSQRIAFLENDHTVRIWNRHGTFIAELKESGQQDRQLAWSPDGSRLATADQQGSIRLWTPEGKLVSRIFGPRTVTYTGLDWLDEERLVTADESGLRFWSVPQLAPEEAMWLYDGETWLRLTAGGQLLESQGKVQDKLVFGIETTDHALELLATEAFQERLAQTRRALGKERIASKDNPERPPPTSTDEPILKPAVSQTGVLRDERILETSGLVSSSRVAERLWVMNDSDPRLFLVNWEGETKGVAVPELAANSQTIDWEDLAAFRLNGKDYLAIGDIGDNRGKRESVQIHVLVEPDPTDWGSEPVRVPVTTTLTLAYEDGPHDCEALAVDAARGVILLVTKDLAEEGLVFEAPLDLAAKKTLTAKRVARVKAPVVTGMNLSPDGLRLVLLTGLHAVEFTRAADETWPTAFERQPRRMELPPLRQGEAITYSSDGKSLFVTSEGERQPLWRVTLPTR